MKGFKQPFFVKSRVKGYQTLNLIFNLPKNAWKRVKMENEQQKVLNIWGFEVEVPYFPKKEALKEARKVSITTISKNTYGFTARIYAGFCGDRQLYLTNVQYLYLKEKFKDMKTESVDIWVKANEIGINKKSKKMEYSVKISVDKKEWY